MLLFYTKSRTFTWNTPRDPHSAKYVADKYRFDGGDGRLSMLDNMTSLNPRPNMMYDWKGFPFPPKGWRYSKETMARLDSEGRIWYPIKKDGSLDTEKRPRLKRYLDEMSGGGVMGNVWTDIPPINSQAQERLGYPTQKPLALLERTIAASSNEGDVVLDPFRGCWTAVHAAQKLNRQWIGIDITHLAIGLIERRLIDAFPGFQFEVFGVPKDFNGAVDVAKRDKFQFQWWAVTLINAVPMAGKMKGADSGIDGYYYCKPDGKKTEAGIVSVKGGETSPSQRRWRATRGRRARESAAGRPHQSERAYEPHEGGSRRGRAISRRRSGAFFDARLRDPRRCLVRGTIATNFCACSSRRTRSAKSLVFDRGEG